MENDSLGGVFSKLWPNWDALWSGQLAGINALVISFLLAIAVFFTVYLVRYVRRANDRIAGLRALVDPLSTERLVAHRQAIRQEASKSRVQAVQDLWREFDETLVESPDSVSLWNTLDAEHFFNSHTLAPELVHNRLLNSVPSILTAIGVLGTFVGLTIGLTGLQLQSGAEVEDLKQGVDTLITGAATAFMTSVWGVFLSLLSNFAEKACERSVAKRISALQRDIDRLFKRHAPEQSLVSIMDSSQESATSLQELHERIGNQLQEAVKGLSDDLESALIRAIDTAMKPAMTSLIESTSQQSTAVFESLVGQFTAGFREVGESQAQKLHQASSGVTAAVDSMSAEMAAVMSKISESSASQQEQLTATSALFQEELSGLMRLSSDQRASTEAAIAAMLEQIDGMGARLTESGTSLEKASHELRLVSSTLKAATDSLTEKFSVSVDKVEVLTEQQENAASLFWQYAEKLSGLQGTMTEAATNLNEASAASNEGFAALKEHQEKFLRNLRSEFDLTATTLRDNVGALHANMDDWLKGYSSEVSAQVTRRMDEWNKHSQDYAGHMLITARAISEIVDELEVRR